MGATLPQVLGFQQGELASEGFVALAKREELGRVSFGWERRVKARAIGAGLRGEALPAASGVELIGRHARHRLDRLGERLAMFFAPDVSSFCLAHSSGWGHVDRRSVQAGIVRVGDSAVDDALVDAARRWCLSASRCTKGKADGEGESDTHGREYAGAMALPHGSKS